MEHMVVFMGDMDLVLGMPEAMDMVQELPTMLLVIVMLPREFKVCMDTTARGRQRLPLRLKPPLKLRLMLMLTMATMDMVDMVLELLTMLLDMPVAMLALLFMDILPMDMGMDLPVDMDMDMVCTDTMDIMARGQLRPKLPLKQKLMLTMVPMVMEDMLSQDHTATDTPMCPALPTTFLMLTDTDLAHTWVEL